MFHDGASAPQAALDRPVGQHASWTSAWKTPSTGTHSMVYRATDVPDLSGVQSHEIYVRPMPRVFNGNISSLERLVRSPICPTCSSTPPPIHGNQPLNNWNVSQVRRHVLACLTTPPPLTATSLDGTSLLGHQHGSACSRSATSFDGDISGWDVSHVTRMNAIVLQRHLP